MIRVIRSRRSQADVLETIVHFYDVDAQEAGDRFGDAVDQTISFLTEFPDVGDLITGEPGTVPAVRRFHVSGFRKYVVYFRRERSRIRILRVLNGSRRFDPDDL